MIRIEMDITYDKKLTPQEEERLREHIRKQLQPFIATVCCSFVRDAVAPDYEGEFIRSQFLNIDGSIKVV